MIVFYDGKSNKLIGTVKRVGDTLVADVESLEEFEGDTKEDVDEFFNQFAAWSNGYMHSFEIPDGDTPEPIYKPTLPDKTVRTAEEIQEAYRKFKDSREADN